MRILFSQNIIPNGKNFTAQKPVSFCAKKPENLNKDSFSMFAALENTENNGSNENSYLRQCIIESCKDSSWRLDPIAFKAAENLLKKLQNESGVYSIMQESKDKAGNFNRSNFDKLVEAYTLYHEKFPDKICYILAQAKDAKGIISSQHLSLLKAIATYLKTKDTAWFSDFLRAFKKTDDESFETFLKIIKNAFEAPEKFLYSKAANKSLYKPQDDYILKNALKEKSEQLQKLCNNRFTRSIAPMLAEEGAEKIPLYSSAIIPNGHQPYSTVIIRKMEQQQEKNIKKYSDNEKIKAFHIIKSLKTGNFEQEIRNDILNSKDYIPEEFRKPLKDFLLATDTIAPKHRDETFSFYADSIFIFATVLNDAELLKNVVNTDYNNLAEAIALCRKLIAEEYFDSKNLLNSQEKVNIFNIYFQLKQSDFSDETLEQMLASPSYIKEADRKALKELATLIKHTRTNPEIYITGEGNAQQKVKQFWQPGKIKEDMSTAQKVLKAVQIVDDPAVMEELMRKRFDKFKDYISSIIYAKPSVKSLIKPALKCSVKEQEHAGQMNLKDRLKVLDIILQMDKTGANLEPLRNMTENRLIDTQKLNLEIFKKLMKECNYKEQEIAAISAEAVEKWQKSGHFDDLYKIANQIKNSYGEDKDALIDIVKTANNNTFNAFRHDANNEYGKANQNTKNAFLNAKITAEGLQNWLHPSTDNNIRINFTDTNTQQLAHFAAMFEVDINELENTQVKTFINKNYGKYFTNNGFKIPAEIKKSKQLLLDFMDGFIRYMAPVWARAEQNLTNSQKTNSAQFTLTIKDHMQQRIRDLQNLEISSKQNDIDLTVKVWERNPFHDILQGNYSTCCIAMGATNGTAMAHYLLDDAFNMIELKDNLTGKTIGNALIYYTLDDKSSPCLVIDNIEISNAYKASDEARKQIRQGIFQYAKKLNKKVTNNEDTRIYLGSMYNDVPEDDLPVEKPTKLTLLGNFTGSSVYLDAFRGWICETAYPTKLYCAN